MSARVILWEWYRRRGNAVVLSLFDLRIKARPFDGIGRLICYFDEQADDLFAFMRSYLKPSDVFVDVGANIGTHSILASRLVGQQGRVFAFEADSATFEILSDNIATNGASNVEARNECLSDRVGSTTFNINRDSAKSSMLREGDRKISLPTNTLDNLLPKGLRVGLLKIDVEGADYLVLLGAKRLFLDQPPSVVVIETTDNVAEIKEFLSARGYSLYEFNGGLRALAPKSRPLNLYAVHKSARTGFEGRVAES